MSPKTKNILFVLFYSFAISIFQFIIGLIEGLLLPKGLSETNEAFIDFVIELIMDILIVVITLKILKKRKTLNLWSLIKMDEITFKYTAISVLFAIIIFLINYCINHFIDFPSIQIFDDIYAEIHTKTTNSISIIIMFVSYSIIAPITEEIITRGFIYSTLRDNNSFIGSMLITFIIFSLFHLDPRMFVLIFVGNILLCYIYEKKRNLFYPIVVHGLFNLLSLFHYIVLLQMKMEFPKFRIV